MLINFNLSRFLYLWDNKNNNLLIVAIFVDDGLIAAINNE